MNRRGWAALAIALLMLAAPTPGLGAAAPDARAGALDLAFGSCGVAEMWVRSLATGDWQSTGIGAVAMQPDGRMVLAGAHYVMRIRADGSLDQSFGAHGSVRVDASEAPTFFTAAVGVQADGKIVVGWMLLRNGMWSSFLFRRFTPSGLVDATFGDGGATEIPVRNFGWPILLSPAGMLFSEGSTLRRLGNDGRIDPTFGSGTGADVGDGISSVQVQPDGRILVSGRFGLVRLNGDGTADATFGNGGKATTSPVVPQPARLALDGAGRVLAADGIVDGPGGRIAITRYSPAGVLDGSFGDAGVARSELRYSDSDSRPVGLGVAADGSIVAAVNASTFAVIGGRPPIPPDPMGTALYGFAPDGSIDTAFGEGGRTKLEGPRAAGLVRTPEGDWVAAGFRWDGSVHSFPVAIRYAGTPKPMVAGASPATCTRRVTSSWEMPIPTGRVPVGGRSALRALRLTNRGTANVRVDAAASYQNNDQFKIVADGCSGRTLAPGQSCLVSVAFFPTQLADFPYGGVIVWHNAPPASTAVMAEGRTRPPTISASGWGWNGVGAVGSGPADVQRTPAPVNLPGAVSVAAGYYHSLAVKADGTVWAWGWNGFGQLGDGTTADRFAPVQVPGLTRIVSVAAGGYHSFAVRDDGAVFAWGLNNVGQLGDGTTTDRRLPTFVPGLPPVFSISAGGGHTLANGADGTVWAWGWNVAGQLGDGTTTDRHAPVQVEGLSEAVSVAAGAYHSVAGVRFGETVKTWGLNHVGQLGDGTTESRLRPVDVAVPGSAWVTQVAAGAFHSLALGAYGGTWAWGWNAVGQLDDGTTTDRHGPVRTRAGEVKTIAAGAYHSLAITPDGTAWGWGWNETGTIGTAHDARWTPSHVAIPGIVRAEVVSGGVFHSLGG